jgi:hypothetical protein
MFAWAGDSRWRQVAAWLLRSAIIVVVTVAIYVAFFHLILPLVLNRGAPGGRRWTPCSSASRMPAAPMGGSWPAT